MTPNSEFKVVGECCKNGVWDIWLTGKSGITLRSCGLNRGEVINRLQDEIHKLESALDWPDEKRIDVIGQNGNDGDHYEALSV